MHFSDSGLFTLRGNVSGDNVNQALEGMAKILSSVENVSDVQFEGAKRTLGVQLLKGLDNEFQRVEEIVKQT